MAKKLDFKQKLLDDLRLRKEQLGITQGSRDPGRSSATNSYESFKRSHGSRDRNPGKINVHEKKPNHHRSPVVAEESSRDIVLFEGPGRSSKSFSDLSMVLAFAIENGGLNVPSNSKGGKNVISHHLQRGLFDFDQMGSTTYFLDKNRGSINQFSIPSYLQIQEISRGAQKLNQILKSCSSRINFNGYSIDVGNALLKGAMDLQESLQMLVNLQEASDYVCNPRRKPIILEEGDEEATAIEVYRPKSMAKPRFSFDGSSRNAIVNLREIAKNSLFKQTLLALAHSSENSNTPKLNPDWPSQKTSTDLASSSRRSTSPHPIPNSKAGGSVLGTKSKNFGPKELSSPVSSAISTGSPNRYSTSSASRHENKIKQSGSRSSEQDKGRIPNVIAKLMGLEELLPKSESKNSGVHGGEGSKHENEGIKTSKKEVENRKDVDLKTKSWEKPDSRIDRQNKVLDENKTLKTRNAAPETATKDAKASQVQKKTETLHFVLRNSQKYEFKIDREKTEQHNDRVIETKEARRVNERMEDSKPKDQKNTKNGNVMLRYAQKPVFKFDLQRKLMSMNEKQDAEDAKHVTARTNGSIHHKEQKNENDVVVMPINTQKRVQEVEPQKLYMIQKPDAPDKKHGKVVRDRNLKNMTQPRNTRNNDGFQRTPLKPVFDIDSQKKLLQANQNVDPHRKSSARVFEATNTKEQRTRYCEDFNIKHNIHAYLQLDMKNSGSGLEEAELYRDLKIDTKKVVARVPPIVIMKPAQIPSTENIETKEVRAQQRDKPIEIEEPRSRKVGSSAMVRPLKQQNSVLQELIHRSEERTSKAKESLVSSKPVTLEHPLQNKADLSSSSCPVKDDGISIKEAAGQIINQLQSLDIDRDTSSKTSAALQLPAAPLKEDRTPNYTIQAIKPRGPMHGAISQSGSHLTNPKTEDKEMLTEHQSYLKQIFIGSPHFLNAAEALFKLRIPVDILHASSLKDQTRDSKLVLDCGYEIMRRKGSRKELSSHCSAKMVIVTVKVKCLDELVKELSEDFDQLKFHGWSDSDNQDSADTLYKMLQMDIESMNPDINCMWDFGWNCNMLAKLEKNEVAREVEKSILDGLINEITRDLLHA